MDPAVVVAVAGLIYGVPLFSLMLALGCDVCFVEAAAEATAPAAPDDADADDGVGGGAVERIK